MLGQHHGSFQTGQTSLAQRPTAHQCSPLIFSSKTALQIKNLKMWFGFKKYIQITFSYLSFRVDAQGSLALKKRL
jgi:hypothetical protein